MDAWVKAGRPVDKFLGGVSVYLSRVLHDSGLCDGSEATRQPSGKVLLASRHRSEGRTQPREFETVEGSGDSLIRTACSAPVAWGGALGIGVVPSRFSKKLDEALHLALEHASASQHLALAPEDRPTTPWNMMMRRHP